MQMLPFAFFHHLNRKIPNCQKKITDRYGKHTVQYSTPTWTQLEILRKTHLFVSLESLLCFSGQCVSPVCEVRFWGRCCCTAVPLTPFVGWPSHQSVLLTQYTQTHNTHIQQKPAQNAHTRTHTAKDTHGKARGVPTSDCTQLSDDPATSHQSSQTLVPFIRPPKTFLASQCFK